MPDEFSEYAGQIVTVVYKENETSETVGVKGKVIEVTDNFLCLESAKGRKYSIKKSIIQLIKGGVSNEQ